MSVFLQSTLHCKGSGLAPFLAVMAEVKAIVEAAGWRLDRAYIHNTGRLHVVVDIWELPDHNAYQTGLDAFMTHPRFPELKEQLDAYLLSEDVIFMTKAEYSP